MFYPTISKWWTCRVLQNAAMWKKVIANNVINVYIMWEDTDKKPRYMKRLKNVVNSFSSIKKMILSNMRSKENMILMRKLIESSQHR